MNKHANLSYFFSNTMKQKNNLSKSMLVRNSHMRVEPASSYIFEKEHIPRKLFSGLWSLTEVLSFLWACGLCVYVVPGVNGGFSSPHRS